MNNSEPKDEEVCTECGGEGIVIVTHVCQDGSVIDWHEACSKCYESTKRKMKEKRASNK
jgi:DnaJ-class molecular chaperone